MIIIIIIIIIIIYSAFRNTRTIQSNMQITAITGIYMIKKGPGSELMGLPGFGKGLLNYHNPQVFLPTPLQLHPGQDKKIKRRNIN